MKRKEFITKSAGALAAVSAVGIIKGVAQTEQPAKAENWTFFFASDFTLKGVGHKMNYFFKVPKSAANCDVSEVLLNINISTLAGVQKRFGTFSTEVKKCKNSDSGGAQLKCCPYEWLKGDGILDDGELGFFLEGYSYIIIDPDPTKAKGKNFIEILDKKKSFVMKVNEYVPSKSSGGSECFLTTACVNHKGLADDCFELESLRWLRDSVVRKQNDGDALIKEYYRIGPAIVEAIEQHPMKCQILDSMYNDLILGSMSMLQKEQYQETVKFYIDYSLEMKKALGVN